MRFLNLSLDDKRMITRDLVSGKIFLKKLLGNFSEGKSDDREYVTEYGNYTEKFIDEFKQYLLDKEFLAVKKIWDESLGDTRSFFLGNRFWGEEESITIFSFLSEDGKVEVSDPFGVYLNVSLDLQKVASGEVVVDEDIMNSLFTGRYDEFLLPTAESWVENTPNNDIIDEFTKISDIYFFTAKFFEKATSKEEEKKQEKKKKRNNLLNITVKREGSDIILKIKAHKVVEDFFKRISEGQSFDSTVYNRAFYRKNEDAFLERMLGDNNCFDNVSSQLFVNNNYVGGKSFNVCVLRAVGISSAGGVELTVKNCYDMPEIEEYVKALAVFTKKLYSDAIKSTEVKMYLTFEV